MKKDELIKHIEESESVEFTPIQDRTIELRDHFAGLAMQALARNLTIQEMESKYERDCLSILAYHIADAMMKQREIK